MGNPKTLSHLTLRDIEVSKSRSLRFLSLISGKGAMLLHMLLFNINRKAYLGSPFVQLHLTLVAFLGRSRGHSILKHYIS